MGAPKPWLDISYSVPSPSKAPYPYCFEAPDDPEGESLETHEAVNWCVEQFGVPPNRWGLSRPDTIFIRDKTDATIFKIRWC